VWGKVWFSSRKEFAVTDWDQNIEYMRNAMQAVEQTHQVADELRNHTSTKTLDEFCAHAQTLIDS